MNKRNRRPVYNEPGPTRSGDVIPRIAHTGTRGIGPTVKTRLTLEQNLRVCGLAKSTPRVVATAQVNRILLAMLAETDSPLSASLRARAAGLAGTLGVKSAASALGRIASDEEEDLATRVGAVRSYLQLAEPRATSVLRTVLASKTWQVRATAYTAAMNGKSETLRAMAAERYETEADRRTVAYVSRFVTSIRARHATSAD